MLLGKYCLSKCVEKVTCKIVFIKDCLGGWDIDGKSGGGIMIWKSHICHKIKRGISAHGVT